MDRDGYAAGTPSWVDIGSTDLEVTHAFYTALFGWERADAGPPEVTGGYGFYLKDGKRVGGYGPAQGGGVWWTTYISVDDAAASTALVEANGGTTLVAPMAVMDAGTMAVFTDPTGAAFSIWQAGTNRGAEVVNEAGAFSWAELMTRDVPRAVEFYGAVFGWVDKNGPDAPYKEFEVEGNVVAAAMAIGDDMPAEVPAHWNVYFGCSDVDATAAKAAELGGTVRVAPFDIPDVGRIAVLGGPHHEGFSLFGF